MSENNIAAEETVVTGTIPDEQYVQLKEQLIGELKSLMKQLLHDYSETTTTTATMSKSYAKKRSPG